MMAPKTQIFYMKLSAVLRPGDSLGFFAALRMTP